MEDFIYTDEEHDRPCEICRHYRRDDKGNLACEKWECEFEDIDEIKKITRENS
ncbi:MAG: hypothetical protein IJ819_00230 [Clostridiales bacterium]|nr:hypothetical protein [Clostridiales bacterium]